MELRRNRGTTSVRTEGGLLPADLLAKVAAGERDVPGLTDAAFGLAPPERVREAITRSWNRLVGSWAALEAVRVGAEAEAALTGATRERFLMPLFDELGFGRLAVVRPVEIEGTSYPISHGWRDRVPIHLVGFEVPLDARTKGVRGAAGAAPHALVQEYLNRSDDALWGLVSNGRTLRLLRDSTSLTRQAFVEFDLESIFEGELFADFALLWSVLHRSRFDGERPSDCLLEQWTKKAADDGTRALDKLRGGVEHAIETLGAGFLVHHANADLREALRSGSLDRQDYYRELLRLVYRLIFLFAAEDRRDEETGRELLLDPVAPEVAVDRYRRFYSTARLRSLAGRRRGTRHPDLWVGLRRVVAALGSDGAATLALPALGSFLFGSNACPRLDKAELRNEDLLDAIRALATIEEDHRLRLVDYRNLGAEELGGVYEGLLELHPRIELDANPPRFSLGTAPGNERKATGSYYTPSSLIDCLLDSALDPVIEEAVRGKSAEDAGRAILGLAVVDPAAGSGHFLVAAAHRLAKRLAAVRTGDGEPPPAAVRHALRDVIANCIYAVDVNPMAVELCKLSLWLEALEPGRPLTFLDAHIKCGNSVIGARLDLLRQALPDQALDFLDGDTKSVVSSLRRQNAIEQSGQLTFADQATETDTQELSRAISAIEALPEESAGQVVEKQAAYQQWSDRVQQSPLKVAADAWCAAVVMTKTQADRVPTTGAIKRALGGQRLPEPMSQAVSQSTSDYKFFHWFLEFPDVMSAGGFAVVLGNPPWATLVPERKDFFARYDSTLRSASKADADQVIASLMAEGSVAHAWAIHSRRMFATTHFLKNSGVYTLYSPGNLGKGDFNIFRPFVELALNVAHPDGRAAQVVPGTLYNGANTSAIRKYLFDSCSLEWVFGFDNQQRQWFDVSVNSVCLYVARPSGRTRAIGVTFAIGSAAQAHDARSAAVLLDADTVRRQAADTYALSEVGSAEEASIAARIQSACPTFGEVGAVYGRRYFAELHMTNDAFRFNPTQGLPVYEGRMIDQYDHRSKTYRDGHGSSSRWDAHGFADPAKTIRAQWYVEPNLVPERVATVTDRYRIGFANIADPRSSRSVVAAVIPPRTICGNKVPTIDMPDANDWVLILFLAVLNSLAFDFLARMRLNAKTLTFTILDGMPMPLLSLGDAILDELAPLVLGLTCVSADMDGFARRMSQHGWSPVRGSDGAIGLSTEIERARAAARIDALVALRIFGLAEQELEYITETFDALRKAEVKRYSEFRTQRFVLEAYHELGGNRRSAGEVGSNGKQPEAPIDAGRLG